MPRAPLIKQSVFPYHVRSRSNNKEWFYLPTNETWNIFTQIIENTIESYGIRVYAFVLMNNHFHMIVSTPLLNLGLAMQYLVRETSKAIGRNSGRINRIFGSRYQRSLLDNENYYRNAYKYVYRNPVAGGLCARVEDYSFSTLNWMWDINARRFPLADKPDWVGSHRGETRLEFIEWLNSPYHHLQSELIRRGLRNQICRWSTNSRFRRIMDQM